MIPYIIATAAVSAAIGAAGAWQYTSAIYQRQISDLKTEYATAQVRAVEIAHADTIRLQAQASKAAADAATRQRSLAADRDRLRAAADGLRDDLATSSVQLPHASCPAVRDYGIAASDVIGECSARLVEVAEKADRAIGDVILLRDAWPKLSDER